MSRIPPVRRWCVRYYLDRLLLAEIVVETINRQFARWMARERLRAVHLDRYLASNRETVSLEKKSYWTA
jgi:hypothetical protein